MLKYKSYLPLALPTNVAFLLCTSFLRFSVSLIFIVNYIFSDQVCHLGRLLFIVVLPCAPSLLCMQRNTYRKVSSHSACNYASIQTKGCHITHRTMLDEFWEYSNESYCTVVNKKGLVQTLANFSTPSWILHGFDIIKHLESGIFKI